ncbi:MAG: hypothetical protein CM1200mP31_1890 [Candidatus Neomarinimicrobiota bacterium]|nr:MAG: hypothetical protein CM1200mP31_1890 [Candidatus Neomarinimicrobiota bacterium]
MSSTLKLIFEVSKARLEELSVVIFSFISTTILFAVFGPIPGIRLNDLMFSVIIFSLKFWTETFDNKLIAVLGPIPTLK